MDTRDLVIHVGYGRTGTTWLQEEVFPRATGAHYLGKSKAEFPRWLIDWSYLDDPEFERRLPEIRARLEDSCRADVVNVVSSEAFTRGGSEISRQAGRIAAVAPHAKILMTVRDPVELITSTYGYCVAHEGFYLPLVDCLDWNRAPMAFFKRRPIHVPDFYFSESVAAFEAALEPDRVHVLRYEALRRDPAAFLAEMTERTGIRVGADVANDIGRLRVNASPRKENLAALRRENLVRHLGVAAGGLGLDVRIRVEDHEDDEGSLTPELRDALVASFSGKTLGYY